MIKVLIFHHNLNIVPRHISCCFHIFARVALETTVRKSATFVSDERGAVICSLHIGSHVLLVQIIKLPINRICI